MEILRQPELLREYLTRFQIPEMFDTQNLHFRLVQYGKGEQILSPLDKPEYILFQVAGSAHIYALRPDAGYSPVAVHTPLTIYGDLEFAIGKPGSLFVEAQSTVRCVALPLRPYEEALRKDARFLNMLLRLLGEKLTFASGMEITNTCLEDQLLFYMENFCKDGCIRSVNDTMMQLHCSRRQLQRVLSELCAAGRIEKIKKGTYRLIVREG